MTDERTPGRSEPKHPPSAAQLQPILADLREANERLVIAAVRLQEVTEEAQDARQAAEAANQAKDEFLAVLSHELRTPLNAILGWIQMLRRGGLSADALDRALDVIERNAHMQMHLISDLLESSQIVTGTLRLNVEPVDLALVLRGAVDALWPAVTGKNIRLRCQIAPGASRVLADPARVHQIIWNLLSNAIKFTPLEGQIEVTLTHTSTVVHISVKDSGAGIDAAFQPRMFERFRQGDTSPGRSYGGLGLGLAIVRQLMELHGGTVQGESAGTGQGALFTLTFPVARPQPPLAP